MSKILIIEDDIQIGLMTCEFLKQNGYETAIATNGIEGVKAASAQHPDVILLDLMLPFKSGDQVLTEIREFTNTPIIILSAKTLTGVKIEHLRQGANDYITKPFDWGELLARIEVQLRNSCSETTDSNDIITYDELILHQEECKVYVAENPLDLMSKEFQILQMLLKDRTACLLSRFCMKVFGMSPMHMTITPSIRMLATFARK